MTKSVKLRRTDVGLPDVSLPQHMAMHGPGGFDFAVVPATGGATSVQRIRQRRQSDLALNILDWALRESGYKGAKMSVPAYREKGARAGDYRTFELAVNHYISFRNEVIATLPRAGGDIDLKFVIRWITDRAPSDKGLERLWLKGTVT